jgi:hypothetical protein
MLAAIENNLNSIKHTLLSGFTKSLDALFASFLRNLEAAKEDQVHLSNMYHCTSPNDYIHTEILYLNRRFLDDVGRFVLDLPNSRNAGAVFQYNSVDEFREAVDAISRHTHVTDLALLRREFVAKKMELTNEDFTRFLGVFRSLPFLTKLSLDFKTVQLHSAEISALSKVLRDAKQRSISSLALDFSSNPTGLDDEAAMSLLDFVETQRSLHSLVLSFTESSIRKDTLDRLSDVLSMRGSHLHFLRLSLAKVPIFDTSPELTAEISKSIAVNAQLLHLELFFGGNSAFDDSSLHSLFYYLQNLRRLEHLELDFSDTQVSIPTVISLVAQVESMADLRVLYLYLNGLAYHEEIVSNLNKITHRFPQLEHLQVEVANSHWTDAQRKELKAKLRAEASEHAFFFNVLLEK